MSGSSVIRFRKEAPLFLEDFAQTPEMLRLRQVGMNCGCEYTAFPLFRGLNPYSRYQHSLSVARIVWDFSQDPAQTLAALFHDIATPTFAHSVDFLFGDHLRQESTEAETERIIRGSASIARLLKEIRVPVEAVVDYHRYPIADNDSPRLSADRLEYTLGNLANFGFCSREEIQMLYDGIILGTNEDGEPELCFADRALACRFALAALRCSRVYVSPEDRYTMQMLAELLGRALKKGLLREQDLYTTEPEVIRLLQRDKDFCVQWERFCAYREMICDETQAPQSERRVVFAKKRFIDPLVMGEGRISQLEAELADEVRQFLSEPQTCWICAH